MSDPARSFAADEYDRCLRIGVILLCTLMEDEVPGENACEIMSTYCWHISRSLGCDGVALSEQIHQKLTIDLLEEQARSAVKN